MKKPPAKKFQPARRHPAPKVVETPEIIVKAPEPEPEPQPEPEPEPVEEKALTQGGAAGGTGSPHYRTA